MILAFIIVFAMRGDLAYMIPVTWNFFRNIQYYLGSMYNMFYGYRVPVNPDPSNQYNGPNSSKFNIILFIVLISFLVYILYQRI